MNLGPDPWEEEGGSDEAGRQRARAGEGSDRQPGPAMRGYYGAQRRREQQARACPQARFLWIRAAGFWGRVGAPWGGLQELEAASGASRESRLARLRAAIFGGGGGGERRGGEAVFGPRGPEPVARAQLQQRSRATHRSASDESSVRDDGAAPQGQSRFARLTTRRGAR